VPLNSDSSTTLIEIYERVVRDHPKTDTLNYKRDGAWRSVSAEEMLRRARNLAAGLHSLGMRKGDRVAILSESCLEWVLADQGCILSGVVTVPIYPTLTPAQVSCEDVDVHIVFALDLTGRCLQCVPLAGGENEIKSPAGEGFGDLEPDTAGTTGDQGCRALGPVAVSF